MKILGLTGDIACGKSTVASLLQSLGAAVIDADILVRELYADAGFSSQVAALFGARVLDAQNKVDRRALGQIVFQNARALKELEALVHPAVAVLRDEKLKILRAQKPNIPAVVWEAVKIIESGQARGCDEVWCIVSTHEIQIERLMQTRGLSMKEARARLQAQPSREEKAARLEYSAPGVPLVWIENNSSREELARGVEQRWRSFLASPSPAR